MGIVAQSIEQRVDALALRIADNGVHSALLLRELAQLLAAEATRGQRFDQLAVVSSASLASVRAFGARLDLIEKTAEAPQRRERHRLDEMTLASDDEHPAPGPRSMFPWRSFWRFEPSAGSRSWEWIAGSFKDWPACHFLSDKAAA